MNQKELKIGIVLPTYNEEENIGELLEKIYQSAPATIIMVVDDSPSNNTADAAKKVIATLPSTPDYRVLKRVDAKGRASAVREGFSLLAKEGCDYIIEMDTDGSHPPSQLPQLIATAVHENADVVICSRDVAGSHVIGWPWQRALLHFVANFSCRLLLRAGIRDYMNAYRIYSRRAYIVTLEEGGKISTGFWAFGESLAHIKARGGIIREIPTIFVNRTRGQSQVKASVVIGCAMELLRVLVLFGQLRFKKRDFKP